ncbi:hypothetical protein GCM10010488_15800 [Oerskovia jenensis]
MHREPVRVEPADLPRERGALTLKGSEERRDLVARGGRLDQVVLVRCLAHEFLPRGADRLPLTVGRPSSRPQRVRPVRQVGQ